MGGQGEARRALPLLRQWVCRMAHRARRAYATALFLLQSDSARRRSRTSDARWRGPSLASHVLDQMDREEGFCPRASSHVTSIPCKLRSLSSFRATVHGATVLEQTV